MTQVVSIEVSFSERSDPDKGHQICDHVPFDLDVEGTLRVHGRRHIYFHQPGLKVSVDEHVESQHFKATITIRDIIHEGRIEHVFARQDSLDDQVIDPVKQVGCFVLPDIIPKEVFQCYQTPFTSKVLLIIMLTLNKLGILLVDTVVGQMLKFLILAIRSRLIVDFSREPPQSFLVDVDSERVDSSQSNIDPQVKLETVDQQGVIDVMAHDERGVFLKLGIDSGELVGHSYAFALRSVVRLHDVGDSRVSVDFIFEEVQFLGENEGFGQEVEVTDAVADLHPRDILVHEVLASEVEGVGEVVDFLVGQQSLVCFVLYNSRRPINRPVFISVCVLETVLVEQSLYQLHRPVLKLVEVADLVVLGHIADLRKTVAGFIVLLRGVLVLSLLHPLYFLPDDQHVFGWEEVFA